MKIRLLLTILLFSGTALLGQNLVINPSFENTSSNCGGFGGEGFGTDLLDWDNANSNVGGDSCSSPDLFSACNTIPIFGGPSPTNMPYSLLGFQYSRTGTRHAGIITYGPGIAAGCTAVGVDNYREYIQGHTTTPLVAGQTYCVSMYVSLGDNVVWATNNLGVRFTNTSYQRDACANGNNSLINLTPQLNYSCTTPITDTANWVRIQWNYVAVGGEQYFTIGNFYNNAATTVGCSNSGASINPYAYYYIDDVSITPNSCCAATINTIDPVCPTDAPFNIVAVAPLGVNCNPTISGTWSGTGITNAANGTFSPAVAGVGSHTITYTLSCGTTVTTTIIVSNCATLVVCQENGNLTVTGGTAPYQWQTQSTVQDCSGCPFGQCFPPLCNGVSTTVYTTFATTPTATPPGTYPIRVIDNAGNSLVIPSLAGIPQCACVMTLSTSSNAATCGNANGSASVSVTSGTGPFTYLWSNGGSGSSINGVAGGAYSVTVTGNGCSSTTLVNVSQTPGIVLAPTVVNTSCGNVNGSAAVSVTSGPGTTYTYLWNNSSTNPSITGLAAGTYTVTVTGGGCSATSSVTVATSTAITLSTTSSNTSCGIANGTASVSTTAGTGPFTYLWSNGFTSSSISGLAPNTYSVTVTGSGNCTATASVIVNPSTGITLTPSSTNANCNQADGSAGVTATGATGTYTYQWSNNLGTNSSISGVATGSYSVTVTSGTCIATQSISVGQNTSMTSSVTGTGTTCNTPNGGNVNLSVSGGTPGYTYLWSTNDTTQDLTGVVAGNYTVTITDASGCIISNNYTVAAPDIPVATDSVTNETCKGLGDGAIDLTVTGGTLPYTYLWSNNATTQDIEDLDNGFYTVTITDGNGCVVTQSATVLPGSDYPIFISQTDSLLTATLAPNYQWYLNGQQLPGAINQTYIVTQTGNYNVVVSVGDCKFGSNSITVTITSVAELSNISSINVFPNPASDVLNVYIELKNPQSVDVNMIDVLGRKIAHVSNGTSKSTSLQFTIPVNTISSGLYFLNIASQHENTSLKVIVR